MIKVNIPVTILLAAILSGCAITPPKQETPPPSPRVKPVDCQIPCRVNSCLLPSWYTKANADEQAALELNCTIVNAADAADCAIKNLCLINWIGGAP